MGKGVNKVFIQLAGRSVLQRALSWFSNDEHCERIVLVVHPNEETRIRQSFNADKIVIGGQTREESVRNALKHVDSSYVMIHDGARPFIGHETMKRLKKAMADSQAVSPAVAVSDTLKRVQAGIIVENIDREGVCRMQTPQGFHTDTIKEAHRIAKEKGMRATCDVSLVEATLSIKASVVEGDSRNIKLTTPEDLSMLELIVHE